ncbi:MAG: DEAD/DEAH box helicase family protein [Bacteroidetes bacterium]|nr:DEAD/DEAH box helicase family protein [Bacteroidota bacterium]
MELKKYQQEVIKDLENFLAFLKQENNISTAYNKHWESKGYPVTSTEFNGMNPYKFTIPNCPHVCIKVPTGGGKTFLSCNAIAPIFNYVNPINKLLVWLVPSNSILEQTLKALKDASHPYRQKLNELFNHRVEVYNKEELLNAQSFNATSVKENLSIMVLSYASLRVKNKEDRKLYQDCGALLSFFNGNTDKSLYLKKDGVEENSLINVIRQLSPVCIVDESHNAESSLSEDMLKDLNPSFILDLTATPKDNSNIITVTDSMALKKANMVKLPVVVYNQKEINDVIQSAINLQKNLENIAKQQEANGGNYIRPIVLFQAQSKGKEDSTTYEKLKEKLIKTFGINEKHIAIKTGDDKKDLKNVNLLSKDCEIRFIITVNALKEGWDCPFAYILATIANRSTPVEVEQILGRILRLPYTATNENKMLNASYVFTCNDDFQRTLDTIVAALNKQGFSRFNTRNKAIVSVEENEETNIIQEQQELFTTAEKSLEELIKDNYIPNEIAMKKIAIELEQKTYAAVNNLDSLVNEYDDNDFFTTPVNDQMMQPITIREKYIELVKTIAIPQFMRLNEHKSLILDDEYILVDKEWLLGKDKSGKASFKLSQESTKINFDDISLNIREVDLIKESSKEWLPQAQKLSMQKAEQILNYINTLTEEKQLEALANMLIESMGKMPPITQPELKIFTKRVIENLDAEKIAELKQSPELFANKLKIKVQEYMLNHAETEFEERLRSGEIIIKNNYTFPDKITLVRSTPSGNLGLYTKEENVNSLESKLKGHLEEMDNVQFWHRNRSRKGFELNGFINHYPDFIVYTKNKKIILIETKGNHINADKKIKLGGFYTKYSNQSIHYFMVFENNAPANAYTLDTVIGQLRKM